MSWKIINRKNRDRHHFFKEKMVSVPIFLMVSVPIFLIFFSSHTMALAAGVGSVYFSMPEGWDKLKEKSAETIKSFQEPERIKIEPIKLVDWRISGDMLNRVYVDTIPDDHFEDTYAIRSWYSVENKIKIKKYDISGFVSFDGRYEIAGNGSADWKLTPILKEAYGEIKHDGWRLRIGRHNVTWGKLDDFTLLDIVNPEDYTEYIMLEKEKRKMPIPMAKLDFYMEDKYIETFFAPWFKPNKINFFGSDWAVFRYLKEDLNSGNYTQAVKDMVNNIRIEDGNDLDPALKNYEFGIRLGGRSEGYDYSLYYMNIHDRMPALQGDTPRDRAVKAFLYNPTADSLVSLATLAPTTNDLRLFTKYNRMHVIGSDFETTVGEFGVRGETGLFLSPLYLKNDFSLVEKTKLSVGLGIDHTTSNNFYCNFQFIEDMILNYEDLFGTDRFSHLFVGLVSKEFMRGRLVPAFYFGYNFTYMDSFWNPKVSYTWSGPHGAFIFTAGAYIFEGNQSALIGRFDKNDLLYTRAEYKF